MHHLNSSRADHYNCLFASLFFYLSYSQMLIPNFHIKCGLWTIPEFLYNCLFAGYHLNAWDDPIVDMVNVHQNHQINI